MVPRIFVELSGLGIAAFLVLSCLLTQVHDYWVFVGMFLGNLCFLGVQGLPENHEDVDNTGKGKLYGIIVGCGVFLLMPFSFLIGGLFFLSDGNWIYKVWFATYLLGAILLLVVYVL